MRKPVPVHVPIPLFEKLADEEAQDLNGAAVSKNYTIDQLQESIRTEVSHILNSRSNSDIYKGENVLSEELRRSPLFYGTIDISAVFQAGQFAWSRLAEEFSLSISRFETRLQDVEIDVLKFDTETQALSLLITGEIRVGEIRQTVTFPATVEEFTIGSQLTPLKT